jgi:riboflavin synthase
MFTGLVEGRGVVREIRPEGAAVRLVVEVPAEMAGGAPGERGCRVGDSVAINGCCLTVVDVDQRAWSFEAGAETLAKTNLRRLEPGDPVNLERPLPVDGRLGGHFVQGHIDGVGEVESVERDGDWVTMWFGVPQPLARQMVAKGSVAVDGISLTLVAVESKRFSVALIPHTLEVTTLGIRQPGDAVNIETDILGKYVLKLLEVCGH